VTLKCNSPGPVPKRGRFYLPPLVTGVMNAGTGVFITATIQVVRNGIYAAFDQFATATKQVKVLRTTPPSQTTAQVSQVGIGNVPDSQRRRRNNLIETRDMHTIVV
jgi:hypothetical protein